MQKLNWNECKRMGKKWGGSLSRKGIVVFVKNGERAACVCAVRNLEKIKMGEERQLLTWEWMGFVKKLALAGN